MLLCEGVRGNEEWRKQVLEGWIHGYQWLFDYYYSVSTEVAEEARKLAIFVDKEGYGSCIREALPPISAAH